MENEGELNIVPTYVWARRYDHRTGGSRWVRCHADCRQFAWQPKLRYPVAELGAHRKVRGGVKTTCPGKRFPMKAPADWSRTGLLRERDAVLRRDFEAQYTALGRQGRDPQGAGSRQRLNLQPGCKPIIKTNRDQFEYDRRVTMDR